MLPDYRNGKSTQMINPRFRISLPERHSFVNRPSVMFQLAWPERHS